MSFTIYPAIDIKDSAAVRLKQGDMKKSVIYNADPIKAAVEFQKAGAQWLHIVDLNGAFSGQSANLDVIKAISQAVSIPIQLGGGIRTMGSIKTMIEQVGIQRVILGTAAVKNPSIVTEAVQKYGEKIAVGIDAKKGFAAVNGWAESSTIASVALAEKMKNAGVGTIIYTDISKDGMMEGPNIKETKQISQIGGIDVILSGGISCTQDIINAKNAGFAGVITGRAIYEGAVDLKEVLKLC